LEAVAPKTNKQTNSVPVIQLCMYYTVLSCMFQSQTAIIRLWVIQRTPCRHENKIQMPNTPFVRAHNFALDAFF